MLLKDCKSMQRFRNRLRRTNCLILVAVIACSPTLGYAQSICADSKDVTKRTGDVVSSASQSCCGSADCCCLTKKQASTPVAKVNCCQRLAPAKSNDSTSDRAISECQCSNGSKPMTVPASRNLQTENSPTNQPPMPYWIPAVRPDYVSTTAMRSIASNSHWLSCHCSPQASLCCWLI